MTGNPFLARVRSLLVEWHAWTIGRDDLAARLVSMGFREQAVLERHASRGVELWAR